MTTYKISKGEAWAKPNHTRLRFTRKGIEWRGRFRLHTNTVEARAGGVLRSVSIPHGTTIKLVGLYPLSSALSPFGIWNRMRAAWRRRRVDIAQAEDKVQQSATRYYIFTQCFRAALRQFASTTHTDSWRVLATWEERAVITGNTVQSPVDGKWIREAIAERGVALRLYLYDNARGAVFGNSSELAELGHGKEIAWMPEDPDKPGWTVEQAVFMDITKEGVHIAGDTWVRIPLRRPWRFFGVSGSHANNGPGRRGAAVDLEWNTKLEVL